MGKRVLDSVICVADLRRFVFEINFSSIIGYAGYVKVIRVAEFYARNKVGRTCLYVLIIGIAK